MSALAIIGEHSKTAAKLSVAERAKRDLDLWQAWKDSNEHPDRLRPLLHQMKPLIRSRANRWANNVDLPPATVHAEFNKQFVNAARTYDPTKGAALGSWVQTNLQKAQRWISTYQNPARIIETRITQKGAFDNAVSTLDDLLGREPTTLELAEHMGWSEPEVTRMQAESRKALYTGASATGYDPMELMPSRETEVLDLVRHELNPEEMLVYEYTLGAGGKPKLRPGDIARKLKMSPSKISRLRNSITAKIKAYL